MQIIKNLNQKNNIPPLALTIGNFDGVHLGHLEIFDKVKKLAKEKNLSSAILTFEPHPAAFFRPNHPKNFRINSLTQKLNIFKNQGIDYAIILPFDENLANVKAKNFVKDILEESLNTKHLTIGYDFIFGKNREGDFNFLKKEASFEILKIPALEKSGQVCSSSLIRNFVKEGNICEANKLLTRNFSIQGLVNEGRKLANQLGFPTANLVAKPHLINPKFGVYKTETFIPELNQRFPSITNFGIKPTIKENKIPLFETYILDFNQNIYGKKIRVEFTDFIRDEKKFESLDELKNQIKLDISSL